MSQELWKSYFETGLESAKAGLIETAVDYFEWAAKIKPNNHEIQYNLGVSFMTLGKMKDAIESFSKAIELNDDNSDAFANRAICYSYVQDKKNSEKDITGFCFKTAGNRKYKYNVKELDAYSSDKQDIYY